MNRFVPLLVLLVLSPSVAAKGGSGGNNGHGGGSSGGGTTTASCSSVGSTGAIGWDLDLGGIFSGAPAIAGSTSYIGQFDGGTWFFAVRWDGVVTAQADIAYSMESAPAVSPDNTTVYVNTINQGGDLTGRTLSDGVTSAALGLGTQALDATSLVLVGTHGGGGNPGGDGSPAVSSDNNTVYAATVAGSSSSTRRLYAMIGEAMTPTWEYETPGWSYSSPVLDSRGYIYFGSEVNGTGSDPTTSTGRITALRSSGTAYWTVDTEGAVSGGPAIYVSSKKTYLIVQTQAGHVLKLNSTGSTVWDRDLHAKGLASPVLGTNNSTVYVTTGVASDTAATGNLLSLVALSERDGSVLWSYAFDNEGATPVVGDNGVYIVSGTGDVVALSESGTVLWTTNIGHDVYYGYMGMNECGTLQIATADGHVVAVQTESTAGMESTSDCPTYRCDYRRTGNPF
jgi:hypothetical protein